MNCDYCGIEIEEGDANEWDGITDFDGYRICHNTMIDVLRKDLNEVVPFCKHCVEMFMEANIKRRELELYGHQ